jgi:hypothetical protein
MSEAVKSVILAGRAVLRWRGGEDHVDYRITVGLDGVISGIHVGPPYVEVLRRPSRHMGIFLHMPEGRRLGLNVAPNGYLTPDGPMERSLDGQDWWVDTTPWLPFETPDRFTLSVKAGPTQIFESHATPEAAEAAFRELKVQVESAEIRPPFGRPVLLTQGGVTKGTSA